MRVAVVHNAVDESDGPDAKDVLAQVETVCRALEVLGHDTGTIACTLEQAAVAPRRRHRPRRWRRRR